MADEKVIRIVSKVEDSNTGAQPSGPSRPPSSDLITSRDKSNRIQDDILSIISLIKKSSGVVSNPNMLSGMFNSMGWVTSAITPLLPPPGGPPEPPGSSLIPLSPGRDLIIPPGGGGGSGSGKGSGGGSGGGIIPPSGGGPGSPSGGALVSAIIPTINANVPPGGGGGGPPLIPGPSPLGPMFGPGGSTLLTTTIATLILNFIGLSVGIVTLDSMLHEIFEGLKAAWMDFSASMNLAEAEMEILKINKTLELEPQVASANSLVMETRQGVANEWIEIKAHMLEIIAPILAVLNVLTQGVLVFIDAVLAFIAFFSRIAIWLEKAAIKVLWWVGGATDPGPLDDDSTKTGYLHNEMEEVLVGVRGRGPWSMVQPRVGNKPRNVTQKNP